MINRVILTIIFIVSLGWIGYVGLDILNNKNNFSATAFFGEKDGSLLIINRLDEYNSNQISDFNANPFNELLIQLNSEKINTVFISEKLPHVLILNNDNWTKKSIQSLLTNFEGEIKYSNTDFTKGKVKGRFYRQNLYISLEKTYSSDNTEEFKFDKKSSAAIVKFTNGSKVESVTDIYFNKRGKVNFITHNENIEQGNQVQDEVIFSRVLSSKIGNYHFLERDYSTTIDPVIKNGVMSKWMLNGFVTLTYNGKVALVSDYILGQDPILILNDINQTTDQQIFSNQLTASFPTRGKKYYAKYLDDLIVFSEDEATCDNIIADFKLGNTISLNASAQSRIYGDLPKSVSERSIAAENRFSKAVYRGKILQTQFGKGGEDEINPISSNKQPLSMNCGFDVKDFVLIENKQKIIALGKKGELAAFVNGKLSWKKQLNAPSKSNLSIIDLHENGEPFILLNTASQIYLWDETGKEIPGFPIELENDASNEVKFYRWKGKSYFLIATQNNRVMHFDAKGRELNAIKTEIAITRKIDVWVSLKTLYAGFSDGKSFYMHDLDRNRNYRSFSVGEKSVTAKMPNELIQFAMDNNSLVKYDQKGTASKLGNYPSGKILKNNDSDKNPYLIIQSQNELHFVNNQGISFGNIRVSFNEIEDVFIQNHNSGVNTVAIIDGIENNVYLYRTTGEKINNSTFEGQTKVTISSSDDKTIVTTIVDQFIVQYYIN